MNPYEANMANLTSRLVALGRGLMRRYRRPLLVLLAASATLAVGVSAGQAPPRQPIVIAAH